MLAGGDVGRGDLLAQPAEAREIIGRQHFLHPFDAIGLHQLAHLDGVLLVPRHPAVAHHIAVGADRLAGARHQLDILALAFLAADRAGRHRHLQPLVAEGDMLLDVVAGAIGGNARLGLAAQQPPHRLAQRLADNIPQRIVEAGNGVHGDAFLAIRFRDAPVDVPVALDVEGIAAHHQGRQMPHHHGAAAGAAFAIAGDALVGGDLHREARHILGRKKTAGGPEFGIDVGRSRDFHALGGPGTGRRRVIGGGLRGSGFTSRMPVILSLDFSCAQASGGKVMAPAATAAAPVRKSRRFMLFPQDAPSALLGKPSALNSRAPAG